MQGYLAAPVWVIWTGMRVARGNDGMSWQGSVTRHAVTRIMSRTRGSALVLTSSRDQSPGQISSKICSLRRFTDISWRFPIILENHHFRRQKWFSVSGLNQFKLKLLPIHLRYFNSRAWRVPSPEWASHYLWHLVAGLWSNLYPTPAAAAAARDGQW